MPLESLFERTLSPLDFHSMDKMRTSEKSFSHNKRKIASLPLNFPPSQQLFHIRCRNAHCFPFSAHNMRKKDCYPKKHLAYPRFLFAQNFLDAFPANSEFPSYSLRDYSSPLTSLNGCKDIHLPDHLKLCFLRNFRRFIGASRRYILIFIFHFLFNSVLLT